MRTKDIIKKSIIESFQTETSEVDFLVLMLITLLIGVYIFFLYRHLSKNAFYSKDFNRTIVIMALVTAAIVYAMQSNLVISLGMVGALSIVRFRNAVKDPLDLVFLFWAVSIGIIDGAGLYEVSVELSLVVTAALIILNYVPSPKSSLILVINSNRRESAGEIEAYVSANTKRSLVKSKNMTANGVDMIIEFSGGNENELMDKLITFEGVTNAAILNHMGERRF